ncbi:transposase [Streptomyces scopuliridis]|uniref:transposase n=1 Tax=Streptomyces scopuliridis TaxID=452529 RepID=UPI0036B9B333
MGHRLHPPLQIHARPFDAGLRRRTFPSDAASLLPGLLAATRTGLPPAGDDELPNSKNTATSRCHLLFRWAHERGSLSPPVAVADAAHGTSVRFRAVLAQREIDYMLALRADVSAHPFDAQPAARTARAPSPTCPNPLCPRPEHGPPARRLTDHSRPSLTGRISLAKVDAST